MSNFVNGSLVFRVWKFDGGAEMLAKFQYWRDATSFCLSKVEDDRRDSDSDPRFFYLAVCEYSNEAKAFYITIKNISDKSS